MKKLLKDKNRGLILGAIVLVFVTGYVIFDYLSFSFEKDNIANTARDYINQYYSISTDSDTFSAENKQKYLSLIDNFWVKDGKTLYDSNFNTISSAQNLVTTIFEDQNRLPYLDNLNININSISVSKLATGYAKVTVSVSADATGTTSSMYYYLMNTYDSDMTFFDDDAYSQANYSVAISDENSTEDSSDESVDVSDDPENTEDAFTTTFYISLILKRVQSDWKIIQLSSDDYTQW